MKERLEVEITANMTGLKKGLQESRDDIKAFNNRVKSETAVELSLNIAKLKGQLAQVKSLIKNSTTPSTTLYLEANAQLLQRQLTQAGRELTNFVRTGEKDLSVFGKTFDTLGSKINSLKTGLSTFWNIIGGATIASAIAQVGNLGGAYEQAEIAFTTMLGSAERAQVLLQELSNFAKETPFTITGIRDSARQLLAMGVSAENLLPTLKMLGDVSAGLSVPLGQLSLAYGQVLAKGRLQGGELKQFTEAGVPLIAILAEQLGKTTGQISKMVEEGQISAVEVTKAFQTMTSEGGKFENLMEKQSKSLPGMISNFSDSLTLLIEKIGKELTPIFKEVVSIGTDFIKFLSTSEGKAIAVTVAVGALAVGMYALAGAIASIITSATIAGGLLGALGGWATIAVVAIGSLAGGIYYFNQVAQGLTGTTAELQQNIYDLKNAQDQLNQSYAEGKISLEEYEQATQKNKEAQQQLQTAIDQVKNGMVSYETVKKRINSLEKIADTQAYDRETLAIRTQIQALQDLVKAKLAIAKTAQKKVQAIPITGPGSILGQDNIQQVRQYEEANREYLQAKKEVDDLEKTFNSIEEAKQKKGIDLSQINTTGGGTGKGKSAETLAKEAIKAKEEELRKKAILEVEAVKKSTVTEAEKAKQILAINEKLQKDIKDLNGKTLEQEVENAKAIIKAEEEQEKAKRKFREDKIKALAKEEEQNLSDVEKLADAYSKLKDEIVKTGEDGAEAMKKINEEIDDLTKKIAQARREGQASIGERGIEAGQELKEALKGVREADVLNAIPNVSRQTLQALGTLNIGGQEFSGEELQKILDLSKELQFVTQNTTEEERKQAEQEALKSKAQLILEETNAKIADFELEKTQAEERKRLAEQELIDKQAILKAKLDAVAIQLYDETQLFLKQDAERREMERKFTEYFGTQIDGRKEAVQSLINKLNEAKSAMDSSGISVKIAKSAQENDAYAKSIVSYVTNNKDVDAESFLRNLEKILSNK